MKTPLFLKASSAWFAAALLILASQGRAQIYFSSGSPYTNNFDTLASTGTGIPWTDNIDPLPGWYAGNPAGSIAVYRAVSGSESAGALKSFGTNGVNPVTDRALGSIASSATGILAYGVRFQNDTAQMITNIHISYTGEQWRDAANTAVQYLYFSYRKSGSAIITPDPLDTAVWTAVPALYFATPTHTGLTNALDGNVASNRTAISATLTNVTVGPNEEIFLRWKDLDDGGNDHAVSLDDLTVSWIAIEANTNKPSITQQPQNKTVTVSSKAILQLQAVGKAPLSYQWYLTNDPAAGPISGANDSGVVIVSSTPGTNTYYCVVSNDVGTVQSSNAVVTVLPAIVTNIAYLRTLVDPINYDVTDVNNVYSVQGICINPVNMVGSGVFSFFIEDPVSHKGIDVFNRGGFNNPNQGDLAQVVAPLFEFNGLLEMLPNGTNPVHQVNIINGGNALPAPNVLNLAQVGNPAYMDSLEGSLVIVSNVYLVTGNTTFPTNGGIITLSNNLGMIDMLNGGYAPDPWGQPIPPSSRSIRGILSQNAAGAPYTNGYQLLFTLYSDLDTNSAVVVVTPPSPIPLSIQKSGTDAVLSWTNPVFNLQSSTVVTGVYTTIGGATSPYTNPATGVKYYRLISP